MLQATPLLFALSFSFFSSVFFLLAFSPLFEPLIIFIWPGHPVCSTLPFPFFFMRPAIQSQFPPPPPPPLFSSFVADLVSDFFFPLNPRQPRKRNQEREGFLIFPCPVVVLSVLCWSSLAPFLSLFFSAFFFFYVFFFLFFFFFFVFHVLFYFRGYHPLASDLFFS